LESSSAQSYISLSVSGTLQFDSPSGSHAGTSETARSVLPETLEHSHGFSSARVLRHLSLVSSFLDRCLSCQLFGYPAGNGSKPILLTMASKSRLVR
jgi:hypothetical protein